MHRATRKTAARETRIHRRDPERQHRSRMPSASLDGLDPRA
jgi:hypothetical protein